LKAPLNCLTQARFGIAWGVIGLAQCVFDEALRYSQQRIMFGKPVAGFQLTQRKFAWMATEITKSQLLNLHLGRLKEAGTITPQQVSMAKMNGCRVAASARLARSWRQRNCRRLPDGSSLLQHRGRVHRRGTTSTLIVGQRLRDAAFGERRNRLQTRRRRPLSPS
jgi:alkylation response protein AidB-like acyl-CoA dehydrogenase